jgi:hypothetical protein
MVGLLFMVLGIPVFLRYAPGKEIDYVKRDIALGRGIFARWMRFQIGSWSIF